MLLPRCLRGRTQYEVTECFSRKAGAPLRRGVLRSWKRMGVYLPRYTSSEGRHEGSNLPSFDRQHKARYPTERPCSARRQET
ncbi:hypothetical protein VFPFJ_05034 [Purpureocillium lilacinum]|uniref:Uncharacterized protein n=1 Tax=Purpureocillium lilacinum TaxID=33203 RepID=A0A179H3M4_PURLI|nr:hypothetical protein VFPFJ_05034 [Purpureocillium lilacinum]OAQ84083.1 hypothetical protein VFPBJ_02851 [Purpureocillium lilacinum]OAQ90875.1 hypothetical protein VFPFJ_05034 [Purpureocillium lilacinum]